ncbi:hypothetical protein [Paraburkholderia lycopersici]|uniref:Uncharacterized protein n=1 Tax=Paraburkholderia lycopersici TaxID=416944 RepID=A0A1G6L880_9BURK|nr:hypothetical protein [Paraburkholderia lycopersici]SDC39338.1 hypothetical protein SAMN05421548_106143 [Paraburkholderia lycopersici]
MDYAVKVRWERRYVTVLAAGMRIVGAPRRKPLSLCIGTRHPTRLLAAVADEGRNEHFSSTCGASREPV